MERSNCRILFLTLVSLCCYVRAENCKTGAMRADECNTCICNSAGLWACTSIACGVHQADMPTESTQVIANRAINEPVYNTHKITKISPQFAGGFGGGRRRVNEPGFLCDPNETIQEDCNTCICNPSELYARCTKLKCKTKDQSKVSTNSECIPSSFKREECNFCMCTTLKVWDCSKIDCDRSNVNNQQRKMDAKLEKLSKPDQECTPEKTRSKNCNECWCTENGVWDCSGCSESEALLKDRPKRSKLCDSLTLPCNIGNTNVVHKPNAHKVSGFSLDSHEEEIDNVIFNPPTLEIPIIVLTTPPRRLNYSPIDPPSSEAVHRIVTSEEFDRDDFKCAPKLAFKLECNTCWCKADGKGARYCTRIACHPKTYKPLSQH